MEPLVVSLASYPPRIGDVHRCIESLLAQTVMPQKIILWLCSQEFPRGIDDLPASLLDLRNQIFDIAWTDVNLKPHNKYYWTMRAYPDIPIVTVDDDILYAPTMLSELMRCHRLFPDAVIGNRTHMMVSDERGGLQAYNTWIKEQELVVNAPSMMLIATGVGGVLYPPHVLPDETFDLDRIQSMALEADDLWLKTMEVKAGVPTVATGLTEIKYIPGTQDCGLWLTVNSCGGNDTVLKMLEVELTEHAESFLSGWIESSFVVARGFGEQREIARELTQENKALVRARDLAMGEAKRLEDEVGALSRRLTEETERLEKAEEDKTAQVGALEKEIAALRAETLRSSNEIARLRQSWSFRVGRAVVKPFSALRRLRG